MRSARWIIDATPWLLLAALLLPQAGCTSILQQAYDRHTVYRDTGDEVALRDAVVLYQEHTAGCPEVDSCQEALRLLGDALLALGRYEEAGAAYRNAVHVDRGTEAAAAAARGNIRALEGWMNIPPEGLGMTRWSAGPPLLETEMPPRPGDAPQPMSAIEELLIEAADLFLSLEEAYEERTAMRYQVAFLLYQRRHYDAAATRWREMAEADPASAEAVSAMKILLPTHHLRQDWAALQRDGRFFAELQGLSLTPEEHQNLLDRVEEARLREAGEWEEAP